MVLPTAGNGGMLCLHDRERGVVDGQKNLGCGSVIFDADGFVQAV